MVCFWEAQLRLKRKLFVGRTLVLSVYHGAKRPEERKSIRMKQGILPRMSVIAAAPG
jgi:hypothetical protein